MCIRDRNKSWREGCVNDSLYAPGTWYWRQYAESGLFDLDKPIKAYTAEEYHLLLYGTRSDDGEVVHPKVSGLVNKYTKKMCIRDSGLA